MDSRSFRLANALVGNAGNAAALEINLKGKTKPDSTRRLKQASYAFTL